MPVATTVNGTTYSMAATYDGNSRLTSVSYASGFVAKYAYTSLGYTNQLIDSASGIAYWTANAMDAEQHLTQQTSGNGLVTTRAFSLTMRLNGSIRSVSAAVEFKVGKCELLLAAELRMVQDMGWINSTGGPLICAERHIAGNWMGTLGLSAGAVMGLITDYDRACATVDYIDVIPCGIGNVLVLGDEPLQSAFVLTEKGRLVIARWVYAQAAQDGNAILSRFLDDAYEISERVPFQIEEGTMVLFDSGQQGSGAMASHERSRGEAGLYHVTTEKLELKRVFSFLIHRFERDE